MPPPCSVCAQEMTERTVYVCEHPHVGLGPKIGSAMLECPIAKGSIWVHVADDKGKIIRNFPVSNPGVGSGKLTNADGYAPFDPLDEGANYEVTVGPVPDLDVDKYFPLKPEHATARTIPVKKGQITSVEFRVERMSKLKVTVREKDAEVFLKDVDVTLTGPSPETAVDPAQRPTPVEGFVTFPRLRKAPGYQARIVLAETDRKKYSIDGDTFQSWDVDPDTTNELTFFLVLMTWIKIQIRDQAADAIVDEQLRSAAQPVARVKVNKLDAVVEEKPIIGGGEIAEYIMKKQDGTCDIEQIEVDGDECYEFVAINAT